MPASDLLSRLELNTFTRETFYEWHWVASLSQWLHDVQRLPAGDVKIQQHKTAPKICSHFSAHTHAMALLQQQPASYVTGCYDLCTEYLQCKMYSMQFATWVVSVPGVWEHDGCHSEEGSLWCHQGWPLLCSLVSGYLTSHSLAGLCRAPLCNWLLPGQQSRLLSPQSPTWPLGGAPVVTSHRRCFLGVIWSAEIN